MSVASTDQPGFGSPHPSFSVQLDKPLTTGVAMGSWCPTMDLLALVLDDGQLCIHRLDWHRLWLSAPDVPVTALGWRPDGRVLATGHQDGSVCLYNVERGELLHTDARCHAAPLCSLTWVQAAPSDPAHVAPSSSSLLQQTATSPYTHRHARLFACPLAPAATGRVPPDAGSVAQMPTPAPHGEWAAPPGSLDILVSTDVKGRAILSAFGRVHLASVQTAAADEGGGTGGTAGGASGSGAAGPSGSANRAMQVFLSADLHQLICATDGLHGGSPACVTVYDARQLHQHRRDIEQLALMSLQLTAMLNVVQQSVSQAQKEWASAQAEVARRLGQLRSVMDDHGMGDAEPEDELVCLLAAGHVSPAMRLWLTYTVTEAGLRRLAKATDLAAQQVHGLLLDHLQPAAEVVVFLLGELRGLALHLEGRPGLGLQAAAFASAELEAAKLVLQGEALRLSVTRVATQLRATFLWLLKTLLHVEESQSGAPDAADSALPSAALIKSTPVDVVQVLDYLTGALQHDAVAVDLEEGAYDKSAAIASLTFDPGHLVECRAFMDIMYSDVAAAGSSTWPDRPLRKQLRLLSELCVAACSVLPGVLSPTLSPILTVDLGPGLLRQGDCLGPIQIRAEGVATGVSGSAHLLCCIVPPGTPGLPEAQQHLLLFRVGAAGAAHAAQAAAGAGSSTCGNDEGAGGGEGARRTSGQRPDVHAVLLAVPGGHWTEDVSFYKDQQLAVLMAPFPSADRKGAGGEDADAMQESSSGEETSTDAGGGGGEASGSGSRLVVIETRHLPLVDVGDAAGHMDLVQACVSLRAVCAWPERTRFRGCGPGACFNPPLLLSGPRGVAALLLSPQRVVVLDLEEDEEPEEGGEEEGEGGGEEDLDD